ncbi:protein-L-isoaspartate O-methyltransferase family protein [Azohydromonas australica]|uniref:protein-L-isoaspartate O-methyltransferase family protein n=1 Tax=Azohydromonas australica TaxID=364039 RepID=UPI0003F91AFE|nr:protein-L-isoaspartate O-methyltransferase [Azohydromonas australica]
MNVEQARFNMIEQQIRPWDVLDPEVLTLLGVMKREDFVPASQRALAFVDMMVPLREGGAAGQCMLEPKVEARLLQELRLQRHEKVLEVGTGSGYMAALLAHRAQQVFTLEIVPELADLAQANLKRAGVSNVTVRKADGSQGLPGEAPFDAIVLSGSVASVPQALLDQLKIGGRLVAVVGQEPVMRATLFTRTGEREFGEVRLFDTVAPRLLKFPEPTRFAF